MERHSTPTDISDIWSKSIGCLWSHNGCRLDSAVRGEAGILTASAGATSQEAGGGMPYSMMCRASTSETSSLSGSGIFFFSSTGRAGGCAGCGCSSSSSYQETSQCHLRSPHSDVFTAHVPSSYQSQNTSCFLFAYSFNCSVYDF